MSNRLEILGRLGNFYSKPLSYYEINIPKLPFNGEMHGLFTLRDFEKSA
jgi:hypothetical protein